MPRIMVIGSKVTTVQRVSRYCLTQGAEVFPYYGIPTDEEITLFAPQVFVLCIPMPKDLQYDILQPYILWSEYFVSEGLLFVTSYTDLYARLQEVLAA
ncbi:MAG: hypothetical protein PUP93_06265 [Rhizonema sp. NSF051]|nr:hypothetical protein [Rhizonema sp. NSF051]